MDVLKELWNEFQKLIGFWTILLGIVAIVAFYTGTIKFDCAHNVCLFYAK